MAARRASQHRWSVRPSHGNGFERFYGFIGVE
jgi:hypothetical protein